MKCSKCGEEFGNGVNCQNCGIDRVAGLANYSGYDSHARSNSYDSSGYGGHTSSKTTVCYACNEIIPLGATYCPVCGKKLLVTCPNCGYEYSSQYSVCSKCGTNRKQYYKKVEVERNRKIIEEQEKERQQKEWEHAQRQSQQQIAKEDIGCLRNMIAFASLCGGISIFLVVLFVHFAFPKQSNEDVEINLIIGSAIAIIVGLLIIKSKKK